ncbi:hypothetical protein SDJN03_24322, partial [Cucurbita argyrosperma subsp. sororia]
MAKGLQRQHGKGVTEADKRTPSSDVAENSKSAHEPPLLKFTFDLADDGTLVSVHKTRFWSYPGLEPDAIWLDRTSHIFPNDGVVELRRSRQV